MKLSEWTKKLLLDSIRETRLTYGKKLDMRCLKRIRKEILQRYFLREITFFPGLYALDVNQCVDVTEEDLRIMVKASEPVERVRP